MLIAIQNKTVENIFYDELMLCKKLKNVKYKIIHVCIVILK